MKKGSKSAKLKYGSVATALTVALIAVVVVLNIVCTTLTTNYSLKLDISGDSIYKLNNQTLQIIDNINKNNQHVDFYVVSSEADYQTQFKEILRRLVNAGDDFSLEFVDPDQNPTFATSFGSQYNITQNALVMRCGDRVRVVAFEEMYEQDANTGSITYLLEERVAAALLGFTQDIQQTVYFVTGHGESDDQTLRNLFSNNGFTVEDIQLYQGMEFDADAAMMIIVGPTRDYSVADVSVVESFLSNEYSYGRHLMFFADATSVEMPNLESLLYDNGIVLERNMVLEDSSHFVQLPSIIQPSIADNDTTSSFTTGSVPIIMGASRSITARFEENGNLTVLPVLVTSDGSYAKSTAESGNITSYEKESGDETGPFNVATLSRMTKVYNNQNIYSYVFAAGSTQMLTSDYMAYAGNGDFLITLYNYMLGQENDTVLDAVKYTSSQLMTLTDAQKTTANVVVMGVIPGIVLLIGIAVFIRRKYL